MKNATVMLGNCLMLQNGLFCLLDMLVNRAIVGDFSD